MAEADASNLADESNNIVVDKQQIKLLLMNRKRKQQ